MFNRKKKEPHIFDIIRREMHENPYVASEKYVGKTIMFVAKLEDFISTNPNRDFKIQILVREALNWTLPTQDCFFCGSYIFDISQKTQVMKLKLGQKVLITAKIKNLRWVELELENAAIFSYTDYDWGYWKEVENV